jgi:alpha-tubulin suppressor-like RCC1 family protein
MSHPHRGHRSRAAVATVCLAALVAVLAAAGLAPAAAVTVAGPVPATATAAAAPAPAPTGAFVALPPTRVLDTRTGVGARAERPAPGTSVTLRMAGVAGVPASGVTGVVLNVTATEPRHPGWVQALPSGEGTPGSSSNVNVTAPDQTVANLVTVPLGVDGAVTLYDGAGAHLVADVLGYYAAATTSRAGRFAATTPSRVLDTRSGTGLVPATPRPLAGGESIRLQVAGRGGVPATGVSAVAMTVTATETAAAAYVQAVPSGGAVRLGATSSLNVTGAGQTVANLVLVPLGPDGGVTLYASAGTHLLADVVGWFTDATAAPSGEGLFVAMPGLRVLDTRSSAPAADGSQTAVDALGRGGVPTEGVSALLVNPIAVHTTGTGYLQLFPARRGVPGATSSVNYVGVEQTVSNAAVAALGTGGVAALYTSTRAHVVVDVMGYFTAPGTHPGHVAWSWGDSAFGALGRVTSRDRSPLAPVESEAEWRDVAVGGSRTVAVRTDGSLWNWGNIYFADFASSIREVALPEQVGSGRDWAGVAAGGWHNLAVKADGTLWSWGDNSAGQLGDGGAPFDLTEPARVGADSDWVAVSAQGRSSAAIKRDGTLWTWGDGLSGQLGLGAVTTVGVPRQVGTDRDWAAVDLGDAHAVGLKTDGSLWSWGHNGAGRLGDGGTADRDVPVMVDAGGWVHAEAGFSHSLGLRADGSLWAWGSNFFGQLGDGTTTDRPAMTRIAPGTRWVSAAAGTIQSAAVAADGSLWSWGSGSAVCAQASCPSDEVRTPVRLGADGRWVRVVAGNQVTVGLQW